MSERCVIVVDESLPAGLAANAAAVLALTLGAREPDLVGADFVDADAQPHPGLIPIGLPVLRAPRAELVEIRRLASAGWRERRRLPGVRAADHRLRRVPWDGRGRRPAAELSYLGVALSGSGRAVRRLTGRLALLR